MTTRVLYGCIVFAAALLPFYQSVTFGYTFDDRIHLENNPLLHRWDTVWLLLTEPVFPGNLYRPVTWLSYLRSELVVGHGAAGQHLTNVFAHGVVSLVLYALLKRLVGQRLGFCTAVLFALHPLHTEVIVNISGRAELLAAMFGLLGVWIGTESGPASRTLRAVLAAFFFTLSAFSKESGIVFPLLGALSLWFVGQKREIWIPLGAGLFTAVLLAAARTVVLGGVMSTEPINFLDNPLIESDPVSRAVAALALLGRYLWLSIAPYPLSADYSYPFLTAEVGFIEVFTALLVLAIALVSIRSFCRRETLGFALVWFFASFLVTSNLLFPIGTIFGERLAYTPSIGSALAIAWILRRPTRPVLRRGALAFAAIIFAALSFYQSGFWSDNYQLWDRQRTISWKSFKTRMNYAVVLRNRGERDKAAEILESLQKEFPRSAEAAFLLSTVRHAEQEKWLEKALEVNPALPAALNSLARLRINQNRFSEARTLLNRLFEQNPRHIEGLTAQYLLAIRERDLETLRKTEERLLRFAPNNDEFKMLYKRLHRTGGE